MEKRGGRGGSGREAPALQGRVRWCAMAPALAQHVRTGCRQTSGAHGASWLNTIERFFRGLTVDQPRHGVFRDLEQLIVVIGNYIGARNQRPKPFIWIAKASDILEKVTRAKTSANKRPSV